MTINAPEHICQEYKMLDGSTVCGRCGVPMEPREPVIEDWRVAGLTEAEFRLMDGNR